jgi:hypothetical protein
MVGVASGLPDWSTAGRVDVGIGVGAKGVAGVKANSGSCVGASVGTSIPGTGCTGITVGVNVTGMLTTTVVTVVGGGVKPRP